MDTYVANHASPQCISTATADRPTALLAVFKQMEQTQPIHQPVQQHQTQPVFQPMQQECHPIQHPMQQVQLM